MAKTDFSDTMTFIMESEQKFCNRVGYKMRPFYLGCWRQTLFAVGWLDTAEWTNYNVVANLILSVLTIILIMFDLFCWILYFAEIHLYSGRTWCQTVCSSSLQIPIHHNSSKLILPIHQFLISTWENGGTIADQLILYQLAGLIRLARFSTKLVTVKSCIVMERVIRCPYLAGPPVEEVFVPF